MKKADIIIPKDKVRELFKRNVKILLATNHLDRIGGTETFIYTLSKELHRKGLEVDVFTFFKGLMSDEIKEFANIVTKPKDEYDLILINHTTCLSKLKHLSGTKVFTSHGVSHDLEKSEEGADHYVAISEGVAETMDNADIIRNGVDCERFKPNGLPKPKPKKVLSICQGIEARDKVETACNELGLEFDWVERNVFDVENRIKEADIVVTLGRGAIESMASGKAVFVYDSRGYMGEKGDGMITRENWKELASHNFSGRARNIKYSVEDIKSNFKTYTQKMCEDNREIALENFNIAKQANEYLSYE